MTPARQPRRTRAVGFAAAGLYAAWVVGQIARDATLVTALGFYIPSAVLATACVIAAAVFAARRRRRPALLAVALAVPPLVFVAVVENDFTPRPTGTPGELKLVHWNTGGRPSRPGVVEHLLAERADLYALSEVPNAAHVDTLRDQLGEGYHAATFGNLAVVGKGGVRADGWLADRDRFRVQAVTWTPAGTPITLLVVDLPSEVWVARDPLLREVNGFIEQHRPDLVVGDFNAPRRSCGLANLPAGYRHAYHTAGGGWGYTWPVPLPVFALDHCLHAPRVNAGRYRLGGLGGGSDHLFQVFEFTAGER